MAGTDWADHGPEADPKQEGLRDPRAVPRESQPSKNHREECRPPSS